MPCGYQLVAGDHDFHVVNLTPSVTLLTEVKANPDGTGKLPSLYKGDLATLAYCDMDCAFLVHIYKDYTHTHTQIYVQSPSP